MKYICIKYPRDKITDFLICLLCILVITLVFQYDSSVADAYNEENDIGIQFLNDNGWVVDEQSVVYTEVDFIFPNNEALASYIEIQKAQGFAIEEYIGKRVIKITCSIMNFPGYTDEAGIFANVFLFNDKIIAADICSVKINGFLQGAVVNENKIR